LIVSDASVLVAALADDGAAGDSCRARLAPERIAAPHLVDLEVASGLRRLLAAGYIDARRAAFAIRELQAIDIRRFSHRRFLERVWELHHNVTPYDAAYVALAEALDARLVTADRRLKRARGPRCEIEVLA
jgi:predicted nucleic acid-binding protein